MAGVSESSWWYETSQTTEDVWLDTQLMLYGDVAAQNGSALVWHNSQLPDLSQTPQTVASKAKSCWRCRKYKKPCDDQAVCNSCVVSGFRIWPSEVGCRRERLRALSICFIPDHFESVLSNLQPATIRQPCWRDAMRGAVTALPAGYSHLESDTWQRVKSYLSTIAKFESDFDELVDMAHDYQKGLNKANACIDEACKLIVTTCQLYHCFVRSEAGAKTFAPATITAPVVSEVRRQLCQTFDAIERLCLSSKPDWFAATLAVSLTTCAAIVYTDALISMPTEARGLIWGELHARLDWIRKGSYSMLIDCLKVSTKGVNPINMSYFQAQDEAKDRSLETLLPPVDSLTLQGGRRLKLWLDGHQATMAQALRMFQLNLYGVDFLPPVGALVRVYEW